MRNACLVMKCVICFGVGLVDLENHMGWDKVWLSCGWLMDYQDSKVRVGGFGVVFLVFGLGFKGWICGRGGGQKTTKIEAIFPDRLNKQEKKAVKLSTYLFAGSILF